MTRIAGGDRPLCRWCSTRIVCTDLYSGCCGERCEDLYRNSKTVVVEHPTARWFWMVLGAGPTSHRHATKQEAMREAERLARINPGQDFYVLEATDVCRVVDVSWNNKPVSEREIPF